MKFSKLILISVFAGALSVLGCDSGSASKVCDECENQSDIPLCESAYNQCKDLPNQDECVVASLALCSVL
jgi:hypothetical protein